VPICDDDPFATDVLLDPHAFYSKVREMGDVIWLSRYRAYMIGRYAPVRNALEDWQRFSSSAGVGIEDFETTGHDRSLTLEEDPPFHDASRAVFSHVLSPRSLQKLRDSWFDTADGLVQSALHIGTVDAVAALAQPLPVAVIPQALGVGGSGQECLIPYADYMFNSFGPENDLRRASSVGQEDRAAWVTAQLELNKLAESGIGGDIWAASQRGLVDPDDAHLMVRALLAAGMDTTVHGLGSLLYALASHPRQWEALRRDPALASVAFDEAIRWESPVHRFFRKTREPVRIGDVTIPANVKVLLLFASANRDARRWSEPSEPEAFDLARNPAGHVAFGMGIHQCVGQHVARLEASALLHAMVTRVRSIEMAGDVTRNLNNSVGGWASIPIQITGC